MQTSQYLIQGTKIIFWKLFPNLSEKFKHIVFFRINLMGANVYIIRINKQRKVLQPRLKYFDALIYKTTYLCAGIYINVSYTALGVQPFYCPVNNIKNVVVLTQITKLKKICYPVFSSVSRFTC